MKTRKTTFNIWIKKRPSPVFILSYGLPFLEYHKKLKRKRFFEFNFVAPGCSCGLIYFKPFITLYVLVSFLSKSFGAEAIIELFLVFVLGTQNAMVWSGINKGDLFSLEHLFMVSSSRFLLTTFFIKPSCL